MRTARFLPYMALTLVVATVAIAGTTWPPAGPVYVPQATFQGYSQLFAWIASERSLGDPFDQVLVRQIQVDSRIEHVRDRSAEPIAVVRVELRNPDGTSRARSVEGNSPFYVVRETSKGLTLLGRMFGRTYRTGIRSGHLEFLVELHPSANNTVQMRFRVEDNILVNLSAPRRQFADVFAHRGS